jgi:DNA processing protein
MTQRVRELAAPRGPIANRSLSDILYPLGLRDLSDAPDPLYLIGEVPDRAPAVAIVGSRAATPYGEHVAHALAHDLAALGVTIVSGLARGIDAAAHEGALAAGGRTVAVVAGGVDRATPRHHEALAARIAVRGALLSEQEPGMPPSPGMFVRRNRLIAALASAVVVVEAAERSGALSTAAAARRLGRVLFAVPGDVDRTASQGCFALLKSGARLCTHAGDVLNVLPAVRNDTAPESLVLESLAEEPIGIESLAARAALSLESTLAALLRLEWLGAAQPCAGQRWKRARSPVT